MKTTIEFRSEDYSPAVLLMIMEKAEEWQCPPGEALSRLLDELAARRRKHAA